MTSIVSRPVSPAANIPDVQTGIAGQSQFSVTLSA
jgi:hypothetical protein